MENKKYAKIVDEFKDKIKINEDLSKYHTFRVKGICDMVVEPTTNQELMKAIKICKDYGYRFAIIGNGSNILFDGSNFKGVLISTKQINSFKINGNILECGCGIPTPLVALNAMKSNLKGLEKLSGVPGTIGGAIVMNAGAYGVEIKDVLLDATVCDKNYNILTLDKDGLELSYRHSNIKEKGYIILSCRLKLEYGDATEIKAIMDECKGKRLKSQPIEYPNAGSIFKREGDIFAGKLIDDCGLKGFSIGGAMVSTKHANFIINNDNASTEDIKRLIAHIQQTVSLKEKVDLHTEVEII